MHDEDCECAGCDKAWREIVARAERRQREMLRRQCPEATEEELDQMQRELPISL
jgi:hypothetical protein